MTAINPLAFANVRLYSESSDWSRRIDLAYGTPKCDQGQPCKGCEQGCMMGSATVLRFFERRFLSDGTAL